MRNQYHNKNTIEHSKGTNNAGTKQENEICVSIFHYQKLIPKIDSSRRRMRDPFAIAGVLVSGVLHSE